MSKPPLFLLCAIYVELMHKYRGLLGPEAEAQVFSDYWVAGHAWRITQGSRASTCI